MARTKPALRPDEQLGLEVGSYFTDPLGYVMFAWPWDTDPLFRVVKLSEPWRSRYRCEHGPDAWQCEYLEWLGDEIRSRGFDPENPSPVDPIRGAVSSGHGIGKSALVAMISSFLLDTRPHSMGIVTANTGEQLSTKTFARIAFWKKRAVTAHWWEVSTGDMYVRHRENRETWRLDGVTWHKDRSEAFAGLHAATGSPFYIFDEASAIHDRIWEVAQGGLTDGEPHFLVFGNPTRNSGEFYRCFHGMRHRYMTRQIDSGDCALPNHRLHQQWIDDYGEDSDFVRIRVRGVFPRASSKQLIPSDLVRAAQLREASSQADDPLIVGVDVARYGHHESVVCPRGGRDARSIPWLFFRGLDGHQLGSRVAEFCDLQKRVGTQVAQIFVDVTGVGASVYDRLVHLGYPVSSVNFGGRASHPDQFLRKDAEMWNRVKEWLELGAIPDDDLLAEQLTHREYDFTPKMAMYLTPKDQMDDGVGSPDRADALALTFASPVASLPWAYGPQFAKFEYDPLANE